MAKKTGGGFAAKMLKSSMDFTTHCPVCGESLSLIKHISTQSDQGKKSMRFKEKMIKVCKCNRDTIFK